MLNQSLDQVQRNLIAAFYSVIHLPGHTGANLISADLINGKKVSCPSKTP